MSKCAFGMKEIKFLGHLVSEEGIKPDKKNLEAVKRMERPKMPSKFADLLECATFTVSILRTLHKLRVH